MKIKFSFTLALIFLLQLCFGQQEELRVLFVGNSYTYGYNLPHIVSIISEGTGTKLITRQSTRGGARLEEHWKGGRELKTKELIASGEFDLIVLQGYSMSAMNTRENTLDYIRLFSDFSREHGAEVCLYNTWARERVPQFQEEIDSMYKEAAEENNALRVPVGSAWELAMDLRPGVDLFTSDGSHPNELGCLLTAACFVRAICNELPEQLPTLYRVEDHSGEMVRLMNHNPEDGEFVRRIANQVIR